MGSYRNSNQSEPSAVALTPLQTCRYGTDPDSCSAPDHHRARGVASARREAEFTFCRADAHYGRLFMMRSTTAGLT